MTQQHIKENVKLCYQYIQKAEEKLKELREKCKHPNQHEGTYSWRGGAFYNCIICDDCGKPLKNLDD